jgi:hypothetical protein
MNLVGYDGMEPLTTFYFLREAARQRVLRYRQRRSADLEKRIKGLTEYINALDPEIWPEERAKAEADRQHLAFRKSSIDAAIINSTSTH